MVSKATITEYTGLGVDRMSVIKKGDTMIILKDQKRIVVPQAMRKKLLEREHLAHSGINRMSDSIRAKYFWPGIEADMKGWWSPASSASYSRVPSKGCLEYVSRPMQAVGIDFFERYGYKYLLLMDHFSGLPMFANMRYGTNTDHIVRQLKRWFSTLDVALPS